MQVRIEIEKITVSLYRNAGTGNSISVGNNRF